MKARWCSGLAATLSLAIGASGSAGASALSDAAAQLQPGQWTTLDTQSFTRALLDDGAGYHVFYYTEDMVWDPVSRQLLFVGGGHGSDAEFLRYRESTNAWTRSKPTGDFWHSSFSHAYDHNAIIPSLGKFFFRQPAYDPSDHVEIYDIASGVWSRSAAMPYRPGCCSGLEYFPELNGLVLADGYNGLMLYDVAANRWSEISGAGWGDYHNFAEYSPVHKVMIFGGAESSGTTALFRLNASRQIARLNNAPAQLGTTHSIVTTDPVSGNFLVFFNSAFYEFNPLTDTWRRMSTNPPWQSTGDYGVFGAVATPISTYGVVAVAKYAGDNSKVYLYKHASGGGTTTPAPTVSLSASPTSVPAQGTSTLTWSATNANACTASGGWTGGKATSGSQTVGPLSATSTFTLTCANTEGTSASRSVTVTVTSTTPAPSLTLGATPTSLTAGGSTQLNWSAQNATGCSASGAWAGAKATSGSENSATLNASTTFNLDCTGSGGAVARSVSVTVTDPTTPPPEPTPTPTPPPPETATDITSVTILSASTAAQSNVPVTFGQVFKPGDVPAGTVIGARSGSVSVPLQVDKKAIHPDGSLRHAVLTTVLPSLGSGATQAVTLTNSGTAPSGTTPTVSAILGTTFDTSVNLNIGGTPYTASARALLQSATPATWLSGPLATEWLLSAPLKTAAGAAHPHLQARFHVRAYAGLQAARVEVVVENDWAYETGPRNYVYDASINVAGRGTVFSQSAVNHYRQSRWRRVVWWGTQPAFSVKHDRAYLMATRAVPTYDTRVQVTSGALNDWVSGLGSNPGVMSIGALEANMPSPGGRFEIAPLPAFQAGYILSQDDRARRATIGYGEQAGAWPMHYRDKTTGNPISIDTYPNATILGASGIYGNFPACGGTCSTNLVPEASHHPSLAYLPYLITGDYYLMEEMVFWGNWVLFYGEAGRRGGSQGLVVWDQVRGQAWALRTLAQTAYATPDSHPMKQYLVNKLQNNITYYRNNWVNSNALGYVTNTGAAAWLGLDDWIASWMDDFLTWTFGHIVGLGFTEAQPVLAWKSKFPVGRLTDPGMCWVLASSYWPYVRGDRYAGGSTAFVSNWTDWRRNVIFGWNNDALRGTNDISGREQELFNSTCGSSQMASILGIGTGSMIGWDGTEAYPANLQAAAAVAVEAGATNAQTAFNVLTSRSAYPLSAYGDAPQWAIFPASAGTSTPPPTTPAPTLTLTANPTTVAAGASSTLAWSSADATSCTASGGWSGSKAISGSQATPALSSSTSYTLTCSGAGGTVQRSATVSVLSTTPSPTPAPTVSLSANPTTVSAGGSTQLSWSSTNATGCTASGAWSGGKAISGNQTITNLTNTSTFTLQCSGAGGSASRSISVTVSNGAGTPVIDLNVSPTYMARNKRATLSWSASNAQTCAASGGWSGSRTVQGSEQTQRLTATTTFTLTCTGSGGTSSESATVAVNTPLPKCLSGTCPAPTATFSANPTQVTSGGSTQLGWSSTNATACVASGGWSGDKPPSGTQTISNLHSPTTFSITCSGAGGRARSSLTVNIGSSAPPIPPVPTVALTANPTSISSGGSTQLTWSSTDATSCTASGDWSGAKAISGTQTLSGILSSSTFTLTCTGAGGSASRDVTVTVSSGGGGGSASLFGSVDSSYIDRFAVNKVYVFNGTVTPDDIDGDAVDPIATVPVTQDANACTFGYVGSGLAAGTYTIAFTNDAGADVPGQSNTLAFVGTRQVTISGSGATSSFRPANILTVGSGKQYATLRAAQLAAAAGAVIEIDAGTYTDDVTVWRQNGVMLRGVGGRAHIRGNRRIPYVSGDDRNNGMGLMVIRGSGISVENFEFSGALVDDMNGAGIRNQGSNLTVCNGYFHDNEDGFLGGAYGTLTFEYSEFANNGFGDFGHNHNVYVDEGERLIFRHNYSHHAQVGHTLKTRARENHILYNRIMDEASGNSSYTIDVPNGGLTFVIGNLLQQGPNTENSALMNYGTEGLASGATHQLYLVNNSFVNDRGSGAFLQYQSGTGLVRTINNLFVGGGSVPSGGVVQATTNLTTNAPGFVNEGGYDYRLTATSPALDAGTAPGSVAGVNLAAAYQYRHKAQRETRPTDARIDIGAYEYQ